MLRDYQSLNGTFLSAKLDVGVTRAALGNGDLVQFGGAEAEGSVEFVVR
jgi:pSer/pThr/pTyr-binding forkhead associated (FHA) protein